MKIITQIENLIRNNKFEHFYLYENVLKAYNENLEINAKWIKGDENSWILGFCTNNNYNIYGINYSQELLNSVIIDLDFQKLPDNLCFSGNKEIITKILDENPTVKYTVYKDRYFYETDFGNFNSFENNEISTRYTNINDLDIISVYNCKFFEEEYNGENNKDLLDMKFQMQFLINNQKIIVGQNNENVIGFCSRMNTEFNNEMIGTVYIESNYRNKTFGKKLLSEMTKNILAENSKSWLMTDVKNIKSNKLVESLGYKKIFKYTSGQIKKL